MNSLRGYFKAKVFPLQPIEEFDIRPPIPEVPSSTTPSLIFSQFSLLPKEIRQEIWYLTLPGPRVLLVQRKTHAHSNGQYSSTTTAPASYGGHQPAILHVNQESRQEALRYLTPIWDAYWNLSLDTPYFELQEAWSEIKNDEFYAITEMAQMRRWGELDRFERIAIDWSLFEWETETHWPTYQMTYGRRFTGYEYPMKLLNSLPNIKCCTIVLTKHPFGDHKLLAKPYVPWRLGPLTLHTTLVRNWQHREENIPRGITWVMGDWRRDDLEIKIMALHDRERQLSPEEYLNRGVQPGEMIRLA